jgi:nucleoside-diphosphate-sugar epimerase
VEALVRCGLNAAARNQVLNIGRGVGISLLDAALVLQELTGVQVDHVPWPEEYERVESGSYVANVHRASDLLGFECNHDFRTGLQAILGAREVPLQRDARMRDGSVSSQRTGLP